MCYTGGRVDGYIIGPEVMSNFARNRRTLLRFFPCNRTPTICPERPPAFAVPSCFEMDTQAHSDQWGGLRKYPNFHAKYSLETMPGHLETVCRLQSGIAHPSNHCPHDSQERNGDIL